MFGFIIISCMLILSNEIYWRDIIRYLSLAHFLVVLFIIPLVFLQKNTRLLMIDLELDIHLASIIRIHLVNI